MAPTIRTIEPDELHDWMRVARLALMGSPPEPELVETRQKDWELDRCFAAFDGDGRLCGTTRTFTTELTLPGGTTVAAGAVSAVGVLATHRRQGNLNAMMQAQLADSVERAEPVSVLVAAEYPIYGRYGYGPVTEACGIRFEVPESDGWVSAPTGTVELVDNDTFRPAALELYDRARLRYAGHIVYGDDAWDAALGEGQQWQGDGEKRRNAPRALWRDAEGQIQGAATYSVDDNWERNRPNVTLSAELFVAATDEAERELVRYLAAVDWVRHVRLGLRPVDDPLPLMLRDGRRATLVDRSDHIWARILDVPAALTARRYGTSGRVVFEVADPQGYAPGRYALEVSPDGADCGPTSDPADLVVPVTALGAAYLGGHSWGRLQAAGWVQEETAGAVETASALFTTPRAPWCAATF